jgi:DUF1365 family protein
MLWCNPRVFGYTFNPLSIYFCYDRDGAVTALVYQVNNTFGQSHSYVAKVATNDNDVSAIKNSTQNDFRIQPPSEALKVRILEHDDKGPILSATFSGYKRVLNSKNLMLGVVKTLGLTWKITAGIHYEAVLLWFKGNKLQPRPAPPEKPSYMKHENSIVAGE